MWFSFSSWSGFDQNTQLELDIGFFALETSVQPPVSHFMTLRTVLGVDARL